MGTPLMSTREKARNLREDRSGSERYCRHSRAFIRSSWLHGRHRLRWDSLLPALGCLLRVWLGLQIGKVVKQKPVEEDVATSHFAQQDTLGGIVQKRCIVPGD